MWRSGGPVLDRMRNQEALREAIRLSPRDTPSRSLSLGFPRRGAGNHRLAGAKR